MKLSHELETMCTRKGRQQYVKNIIANKMMEKKLYWKTTEAAS